MSGANTTSARSWPISWPSNTAATTRRFSAAPSACAATAWRSGPPTSRTGPGSCRFFGEELESITEFDPLTGQKTDSFEKIRVYANSHYVTPRPTMQQAMKGIKAELRPAAGAAGRRGQAAGGPAAGTAHEFRPRDAGGHRRLQRDRELLALPHGPRARRTAPDPLRIHPRQRHRLRRRKPRLRPRRSAACIAATTGASSRWPSMASACPPAWTTAP
jgi:hypothetical protein